MSHTECCSAKKNTCRQNRLRNQNLARSRAGDLGIARSENPGPVTFQKPHFTAACRKCINWAAPASSGDEPEPARPAVLWNRTVGMDEAARAATDGVSDTVTADADWERLTYITERIAAFN